MRYFIQMLAVFLVSFEVGFANMDEWVTPNKYTTEVRNFRAYGNIPHKLGRTSISSEGVAGHLASASGQFSGRNIKQIVEVALAHNARKLLIVNLRLESYYFINDLPLHLGSDVKFDNLGQDKHIVKADESEKMAAHRIGEPIQGKLAITHLGPTILKIADEETIVRSLDGIETDYIRLPVPDHCGPPTELVNEFLSILRNLEPDTWLHVHCNEGQGRASSFILMYDMFFNAKTVSFHDIMARQTLNNGKDFYAPPKFSRKSLENKLAQPDLSEKERKEALSRLKRLDDGLERVQFLERFYHFCQQENPRETNWSTWMGTN